MLGFGLVLPRPRHRILNPCNYSISCSYCNVVVGYYFQWQQIQALDSQFHLIFSDVGTPLTIGYQSTEPLQPTAANESPASESYIQDTLVLQNEEACTLAEATISPTHSKIHQPKVTDPVLTLAPSHLVHTNIEQDQPSPTHPASARACPSILESILPARTRKRSSSCPA
jgi:hypothetical protein